MMKTGGNVKEGVRKEILDLLDEWNLKALDTDKSKLIIRESDLTIILQNGSELIFKSLDKSSKAKGLSNISDIYLDEADSFSIEDYISLNGSLRSTKYKNLQLIVSYNPCSMQSWIYKYFGHDTGIVPENTLIVKTTWKDNEFLSPTYYEEFLLPLKEINPRQYEIDANGLFQTNGKLVFEHNWTVEEFNPLELVKNNDDLKAICSLDWGWEDPTAIANCLIDNKLKIIYICDEIYKRGLTNENIVKILKEKGWYKYQFIADNAEPKDIQDLKDKGIKNIRGCKKGGRTKSIVPSIRKLQEYKIIIHPKCTNTIIEFNNYTWKQNPQTLEYVDSPIDAFCHIIDGLRYIIMEIKAKAKIINVKI